MTSKTPREFDLTSAGKTRLDHDLTFLYAEVRNQATRRRNRKRVLCGCVVAMFVAVCLGISIWSESFSNSRNNLAEDRPAEHRQPVAGIGLSLDVVETVDLVSRSRLDFQVVSDLQLQSLLHEAGKPEYVANIDGKVVVIAQPSSPAP